MGQGDLDGFDSVPPSSPNPDLSRTKSPASLFPKLNPEGLPTLFLSLPPVLTSCVTFNNPLHSHGSVSPSVQWG